MAYRRRSTSRRTTRNSSRTRRSYRSTSRRRTTRRTTRGRASVNTVRLVIETPLSGNEVPLGMKKAPAPKKAKF